MNGIPELGVGDLRLPSRHPLRLVQVIAVVAGLAGVAGSVLGYWLSPVAFFRSYLIVFLFWLGFALGPIGILGLQYVTGGRWGVVIRRPLEAAAATLPLMAVLFVPLALGLHEIYEWTNQDIVAHDIVLQRKAGYLNERFFMVRAVVYFGVWITLSNLLCNLSLRQDVEPGAEIERKLQLVGRATLVAYGLTMTFAAVDWAMSVDAHWFSHIYGLRIIGGQILTAFAFVVAIAVILERRGPLGTFIAPNRFHDLGNLMLAFVMLWAYFELSQFLIIWSADLPEETSFYIRRLSAGWGIYGSLLVVFHFAVPFVVLLSRPVKRSPGRLAAVALFLLLMRAADVYWQIAPSFRDASLLPHWVLVALLVGMGGIWLAAYVRQLAAHPLLPVTDTTLLEAD
jgi:hypothetical protein